MSGGEFVPTMLLGFIAFELVVIRLAIRNVKRLLVPQYFRCGRCKAVAPMPINGFAHCTYCNLSAEDINGNRIELIGEK